jgi:hypothetical protein
MANLITEKQKRAVRIDYLTRLFSVSMFVPASLLGFFLLAYIVPYYISVNKKDMRVAEQFDSILSAENKENIGENVSQIVIQTLDKMKVLETYQKNSFIPSVYFNKIIENKNNNIEITRLSLGDISLKEKIFLISGFAHDRDSLVSFIEDLKTKAGFTSVDMPISDFALDSNIPFTLNVKLTI